MKTLIRLIFLTMSLLMLNACTDSTTNNPPGNNPNPSPGENPPAETVITLTFSASSPVDYTLEQVEGATDVATPGADPELTLTIGKRYRIINQAFGAHPFALTSNETYSTAVETLLLKDDGTGSFATNPEVQLEENSDGITFTLTAALAAELKSYLCTFHSSMFGKVTVK